MRTLLMTATITPRKGEPLLKRTDPESRMQDYEKAFLFYLNYIGKGIDHILFVENSEADLSWMKKLIPEQHQGKVEIISFYGLDYPVEHGRGYGEFRLIDYAMKHSSIIKKSKNSDYILKITGRYQIVNFDKVLKKFPENFDLYCNHRNFPMPWADMFFIAWNKGFYFWHFDKLYEKFKMDENGEAPEVSFRKYLTGIQNEIKLIPRYKTIPAVDAAKAMNNQSYQGFANKSKFYARVIMNKILPWLWV
ncbi:MAG: hypothetical protein K9H64_22305 [Bacteroidales bacterium]|nr:hypothetical protein [Bacteroidales bacterium]MCF8458778.1 hypothetical protein [Bacteroidales bacterium]